jgi:hypothetical protein
MDSRMRAVIITSFFVALGSGCGPNEATDPTLSTIGPPQNLKSVSLNKSTVGLKWDPPLGASDSSFAGYTVQYGNRTDTLARVSTTYVADSLGAGESTFAVSVRTKDGRSGDGAMIRWAPAERFVSAITLTEYTTLEASRLAGLRVGGKTTDPVAVAVNPATVNTFDIYLYGGAPAPAALPLFLWSASLFTGATYRATVFSSVQHSSSTLNYYTDAFPAASTFTLTSVQVTDNTIYYARVVGDNSSETHYVRILVQGIAGGYPARSIRVTISLQRVPGLQYAVSSSVRCPQDLHAMAGMPLIEWGIERAG